MAVSSAESFLEAEQAIRQVTQHMESLKSKISSYTSAETSLTGTRDDLVVLTRQLGDLTQHLDSVVLAVRQVGVPAIMDELRLVREQVGQINAALDVMQKNAYRQFREVGETCIARMEQLKNSQAKLFRVTALLGIGVIVLLAALLVIELLK